MINNEQSELELGQFLFKCGYLIGPKKAAALIKNSLFNMIAPQWLLIVFLDAKNSKCKYRHSIRTNSFYLLFPKIKLNIESEIIK